MLILYFKKGATEMLFFYLMHLLVMSFKSFLYLLYCSIMNGSLKKYGAVSLS